MRSGEVGKYLKKGICSRNIVAKIGEMEHFYFNYIICTYICGTYRVMREISDAREKRTK